MKRLSAILLSIMLLSGIVRAQEQPTIRQQADKLFERFEYFKSLGLYLKLADKKYSDGELLERIADCYRNINNYSDAEKWYAKAVSYPGASDAAHYNYAEVLLRNQKFTEAKKQYQVYFTGNASALKLKLAVCDSAAAWMKAKSGYAVKIEPALNSSSSDWGLAYAGDGFIFTSDRKADGKVADNRTGNNWFKLYQTNGTAVTSLPLTIRDGLIKGKYHVGPAALNATADTAYITIATDISPKKLTVDKSEITSQRLYTRRLQLVIAAKNGSEWVIFENFTYNDVQRYSIGNAALSADGKVLYFTSDMEGGQGKTDIWYCTKQADGTWGKPVNCGKDINTQEEEDFPTTGNNDVLYFSSKGLPGMGGFDIFRTSLGNDKFAAPENLKYPANSTSDDFYLTTRNGLKGYLSSNREGGSGSDDIYSFTNQPVDNVPAKIAKRNDEPVPAKPAQVTEQLQFDIQTIYYDLDKSDIRLDAVPVMDKLVLLLKEYTSFKLQLSSYTDSRASVEYNMALSQRRVKAAMDYLIAHGVTENRLIPGFYGKNNLVNKCADGVNCTEAEQQMNRRTEFKLVEHD